MAEFTWEARTRTGDVRKGTMEADSAATVNGRLRTQQLIPIKIRRNFTALSFTFGSGVGQKDLVTFTRLFATMVDAGLPIIQCLDILQAQGDNAQFSKVLRDVKSAVEQGATLSDALRRHPKVFDSLFVNLVQAGEAGGILDTILDRLAIYIEKAAKLKRQLKGALVYPISILVVFSLVLSVLLGFVIPAFEKMFADFGAKDELPELTKMVIAVSNAFIGNLVYIVPAIALIAIGLFQAYKRSLPFKRFCHGLLLRVPVVGNVLRKIAVARFTRTFGTLLGAGVPILDALDIVARTAGNIVIEEAILYTRAKISEGKNLAGPLLETKVFPPMVVEMVGVGEQTGALDAMLNKIADFYEEEVDAAVTALTTLIEPVMMVGIGGTVGVVLIAMYLPIFGLAGKIKAG